MLRRVRIALVANARSGAGDRVAHVRDALAQAGADVELLPLGEVCDGTGALRDGVDARGADRVVVAGGDGSVGPGAALAAREDLPLAVVPIGTANDFARWLGLPLDAGAAARLAADPQARLRVAELAEAAGRPFVNAASTGLSVLAAERARPLKPRLGPLAYAVGAVRAGVTGRPLHVTVQADGTRWSGDAWQVVVAATGAFGAGSETGGTDPRDLRLDVAVVEAGPRRALVRRAFAMKRGALVHDDGVRHLRGREVTLTGAAQRFNVDGEVLEVTPAHFRVRGAFKVVTHGLA